MALTNPQARRSTWSRDRMPLVVSLLVGVLLLALLPSSLNLPQSNPSETLEYAPVPPEDSNVTPPAGNFSSLGLGSSSSLGEALQAELEEGGGGPAAGRTIKRASTKRCVGRPPRQTEDPLSPPCVASFEGNNGGATYPGVSTDEIRVLFYWGHPNENYIGSRGSQTPEHNKYYDLGVPPSGEEPYVVDAVRTWQRYFNERFQTYGRFVRFHVHFGRGGGTSGGVTAESRAADAADALAKVKPFAAVLYEASNPDAYITPLARRGVLTFGAGRAGVALKTYQDNPGLVWGYEQPADYLVGAFNNMLCRQVVGRTVADAAPEFMGRPRKLGLVHLETGNDETVDRAVTQIKAAVSACGGKFEIELTHPIEGSIWQSPHDSAEHEIIVSQLKSEEITTVIWPYYYDKENSEASARANYRPEWIILTGNGYENIAAGKWMEPTVWDHAWVFTPQPAVPGWTDTICFKALRESNPEIPFQDTSIPCRMYQDLRQLFIGIQVAGPKLTPSSIDKGFHAIPNGPSNSITVPACFYLPNDYTCVKDNALWEWDSFKSSEHSSRPGCYSMTNGAERFLPDDWPRVEMTSRIRPTDLCSGFNPGSALDPAPGPGSPPNQ